MEKRETERLIKKSFNIELNNNATLNKRSKNGVSLLTLTEVGEKIRLKDISAIKNWLIENDIEVFKISKSNLVFEYLVDFQLNKLLAEMMRKKIGPFWQQCFRSQVSDQGQCEAVISHFEAVVPLLMPKTRNKLVNSTNNRLMKKYNT
ncbi:hypothetical protein HNP99_001631 [Flavobacterium sp. 28A]|uniref:hypothetical protein n=1 Tax=Flavobacterium sp. 28A TaxID=2735895 RepID=UPI00157082D8|nr:hypothetical protein [Flavobacterium sp. 28A]NRT15284.1 hypothetical protein [Flavobacterium sp. 28A]